MSTKQLNIILDQLSMQVALAPDGIGVHLDAIRNLCGPGLDRLASIDAARLPESVADIDRRRMDTAGGFASVAHIQAYQDRVTLLDIVRAQQTEIAQLEYHRERALELVEQAKAHPRCLACETDFGTADEVRKHARDCEPHELCQALKREAAEKMRGDRLAEGVMLLRRCANAWHSDFPAYQEWFQKHKDATK